MPIDSAGNTIETARPTFHIDYSGSLDSPLQKIPDVSDLIAKRAEIDEKLLAVRREEAVVNNKIRDYGKDSLMTELLPKLGPEAAELIKALADRIAEVSLIETPEKAA